jgi:hypothetical protein
VSELPVRLTVGDELERNRLGVFFRALLAVPHIVWLFLWGVGALFAAILNWVATLLRGRSPGALHEFLASYVRYVTHVYAYLYLAAEKYPGFLGQNSYPVDVEIAPPQGQNRWKVAFRAILAIPATLLGFALASSNFQFLSSRHGLHTLGFGGLLGVCALLGWFASLVRGRMPRGLRDAVCYALFYNAQLMAYWFVLTDRYPSADPELALPAPPTLEHPVGIEVRDDSLRRSRLTVFFRVLLAIPHFVWLTLWGIVVYLAVIVNWFATLITGSSPAGLHRFISSYLRYQTRVYAYLMLLANPFPGFGGGSGAYPLELRVDASGRQNRWTVLFRSVLFIPALLLSSAYGALLYLAALLGWFAALFTGRMPRGLWSAGALALRYTEQLYAYMFVLTDRYPYSGPVAREDAGTVESTFTVQAPSLPT